MTVPDTLNAKQTAALKELIVKIQADPDSFFEWTNCSAERDHVLRFLDAKSYHVEDAYGKLKTYHEFVKKECPKEFPYETLKDELATGKVYLLQPDLEGNQCILVMAKEHRAGQFPRKQTMQLTSSLFLSLIAAMDNPILNNGDRVTVIVDLKGFGFSNKDDGILKDAGAIVSKYFPNRIRRMVILNAGFIVNTMWMAIRPLIPSRYLDLIQFLRQPKDLTKICPKNDLPITYGGIIVPNWEQWLDGTNNALRTSPVLNIHKFCRRAQGEIIPESELDRYEIAAYTDAEFVPEGFALD
ncbi:hypothetical protein SARC_01998 [Sphaeroforma arctica JP610]|uniref:CRAL-TRIO domain-containing protein n=1 Tax=Sphaeroforma arctica JP610 TaxID=667725 RepID=A0A0L0GA79_9EUKA|nr:hypothetical protein SARC_01998 [Sphaeroforma arctica JP610]KNC85814.1 hypothetical protein SARC_01998 [Sphaeroforma arctica JP610]|eukprot:XP_014159716.1 hypothetical protein SARC_01998 [Sphaeroforma arctica JP610]